MSTELSDDSQNHIGVHETAARVLARLSRLLEHALHDAELTLPQYRLLSYLERRPDGANRLASNMHVRPPSLTALVDGLVERGLVKRTGDLEDRRRVRIDITEPGRTKLRHADSVAAERLRYVEGLDPDERSLIDSLPQWQGALDEALQRRAAK